MTTIIGITHSPADLHRYFADADLARLRTVAEVRVLGGNQPDRWGASADGVSVLLGSWGMPRLDEGLLTRLPALRAVCYAAGTVKGFVTDESYARGVLITTAMHANAIPVAETTVALITLANKGWFAAQDGIRRDGRDAYAQLKKLSHPGNFAVAVGLIGYGAIGREVHARLRGMELRIVVHDPYADPAALRAAGAEPVSLHELAATCEVVSLHAPNIPATTGMCDATFFAAMRDGAVFINTARGHLVVEDALVAELRRGRISAMLDVTQPEPPEAGHPFYTLPNCWLTPHRAGSIGNEVRRMGRYAIEECLRLIAGEPLRHPVSQEMLATMA